MEEVSSESPTSSRNLSHKIISITAGEAHTLALTGDGRVYSWGRGNFGRLGTGSESDQLFPIRVNFPSESKKEIKIIGISTGAYHSLALSDDGSIWGWGYNTYGQLSANEENSLIPRLIEGFADLRSPNSSTSGSVTENRKPLKISSIKAGGMMSLAIDDVGGLWMWGNCPYTRPQPNEEQYMPQSTSIPIPVWNFHDHTVTKVACGQDHVIALVSAEETYKGNDLLCYSWGGNQNGQLGLGDKENRSYPEAIKTFNLDSPYEVYDLACGALHTVLLTRKRRPSDELKSMCWTFGLGDNGQLGHGTTKSYVSPERVTGLPENTFLISVDCGLFHTSVVSSVGEVWSWGMEKGLGLCPDGRFTGSDSGDAVSPLLINCPGLYGPRFPDPVQVTCGAAHTIVVADSGYKLWAWGRGWSGVLGNGQTNDSFSPVMSMWPPLNEEFIQNDEKKGEVEISKEIMEMEKRLSMVMEEMKLVNSKLLVMERYASILHGSVFGKPFEEKDIPVSLQGSGTFDIGKEWESMLDSYDRGKLVRLEMFYRNMLVGVKDKVMKKRIQEIVNECIGAKDSNTSI